MDNQPLALPVFAPGSVWLVGAGPGDPGLLTLTALHGLRHADIVLHDALLDPGVLALVRPGAVLEDWGKRGGRASPDQDEITDRLIVLARSGARVLRLKGGDPFMFGRGAEEAVGLALAGIPIRVVPGVTAGIGGLALAGIPVTAGECNAAVAFVSGHGPDGRVPADLDRVARAPVLVIYMGLGHLDALVERLLAAGRQPDEPAALIASATTTAQTVTVTTLAGLGAAARDGAIRAPALVAIGPVVTLRDRLKAAMPAGALLP